MMERLTKKRILALCAIGAACFFLLIWRLVVIQVVGHDHYLEVAVRQQLDRIELQARRGLVLDRNGEVLAKSVTTPSFYAVPSQVEDEGRTAVQLSESIGVDKGSILTPMKRGGREFVWLERQVKALMPLSEEELGLPGVYVVAEQSRSYPLKEAASHIIGIVDCDGRGLEGIEKVHDQDLRGESGWATICRDATGERYMLLDGYVKAPKDGASIVLTIDARLQSIVASRLHKAVKRLGAKGGCVVMVDPTTGEILALANEPCFRPPCEGGDGVATRNAAVTDLFEPGSTFKLVAASAVLEEKIMNPLTRIFAENGKFRVAGQLIHDHHPHDWVTLSEAVTFSSNIAMAKVALELGQDKLFQYCRRFGFGEKTGVTLPGEGTGVVRDPSRWSARSTATIAFGQEVSVTAIQMAMAYSAIANSGVLVKPIIVSAVRSANGEIINRARTVPVRRVVSEETAAKITDMLVSVVEEGTGKEAALPWARVAGKTGTAEVFDPETKSYSNDKYVASFIGFAPAYDPKVVCLVVIDQPEGISYGGLVSAPLFREIMEAAAQSYGFPVKPGFREMTSLASYTGPPPQAVPAAGHPPSGGMLQIENEPATAGAISDHRGDSGHDVVPGQMPAVVGLSLRKALDRLARSGLDISRVAIAGQGVVFSQLPAPGTGFTTGQAYRLDCSSAPNMWPLQAEGRDDSDLERTH
jgi:cell division protein FtsI (penicillin-binding protein 3)